MCWTCDCWEAPRPCAADSRRLCPFSPVGTMPDPHRVLACCYLFIGKLHSLQVAFVASTLWVRCVGSMANCRCLVVMVLSAKSTKAASFVLLILDDANDIG